MQDMMSKMRREVLEIPDAVDRLLTRDLGTIDAAADTLRQNNPAFLATVARGSSDHVATYLKYASELLLGVPVASLGPSIASIYDTPLKLEHAACISISQSGKSPDIVAMAQSATDQGALTLAITNDPVSPLAEASQHTIDIHAGPELSVAATKTFVNSAVAALLLLARWKGDVELMAAIHTLPDQLAQACQTHWPNLRDALDGHSSVFTLGRGPSWAMSNEAALKFKETCQIHAESYSSAEVLHGPVSIVGADFPVLGLTAADAAEDALVEVADAIAAKGAKVFVTSDKCKTAERLEHIRTDHPLTDPISLITSFYAMVERLATARGINPDTPRHLKKVTKTR